MTIHEYPQPGAVWMEILRRPGLDEFSVAFSEDVIMEASVLPSALFGPHDVRELFEATKKMYTSVGFTSESTVGVRTFLQWEGLFDGNEVAGVTTLQRDDHDRICAIHLHHRPYHSVLAFSAELERMLKGRLHFDPYSV